MFNIKNLGMSALLLTFSEVYAIEYRPNQPQDATPWHNYNHYQSYSFTNPRLNVEGHQVNRFPNPVLAQISKPRSNQNKLFDLMNLQSDPICSSAGCTQYKHPEPEADPPRDYPVPDFGEDPDIAGTISNEAVSSKIVGHTWKFKTPESWEKYRNKAKDTDYNFAPELDDDIKTTVKNAGDAEKNLG